MARQAGQIAGTRAGRRRGARAAALFSSGLALALGATPAAHAAQGKAPIRGSKHDLSASGGGSVRATAETEVCIFCHGTHGMAPQSPLWNRNSSGAVYTPYSSSTAKARPGQPTGASKLCLSCHDGTVALGMVRNRKQAIHFPYGGGRMPLGPANLGTDLSDDHPISFKYDRALVERANGALRDPTTFRPEVQLDKNRELQCTTCHDPHSNQYGDFLVLDNRASALCLECHDNKYWNETIHSSSTARWNGGQPNPWAHTKAENVVDGGCSGCHASHNAGTHQRLLVQPTSPDTCLVCHNGNVAAKNLTREFRKGSIHDVYGTYGIHDPIEDVLASTRHVDCSDCHNGHAVSDASAKPPDAPGSLRGLRGISSSGAVVSPLTREYELCFRCHADSSDKKEAFVPRVSPETNLRRAFDPSNPSYHPVVEKGRGEEVPSLKTEYRLSSLIYCTDCHNNDQGPNAGGSGPNGPHGSVWAPILERRYEVRGRVRESELAYALCYKCHERTSILGDESFPLHKRHLETAEASCAACHDAHGSPLTHLINFNPEEVTPSSMGRLEFLDRGRFSGQCNLSCHGHDHVDAAYPGATPGGSLTPLVKGPP